MDQDELKETLARKIKEHKEKVKEFRLAYGSNVIDQITIDQVYGGMRGLKLLIREISSIDPQEGTLIRGHSISELRKMLPKNSQDKEPLPEGLFWLFLTGEMPNEHQVKCVSKMLAAHAQLPPHVINMLNNFPTDLHPIKQFSAAIIACSNESLFAKAHSSGASKNSYWETTYDDAIRLIAKLPTIAAIIYRNLYCNRSPIGPIDVNNDWSTNFSSMLGFNDPKFAKLMRLFLTIHR